MFGQETRRTVVASVELNEVATFVIVVYPTEETARGPAITRVGYRSVARSHTHVRVGGRVNSRDTIVEIVVVVVFFLVATHKRKVVGIEQGERIIAVKADVLVACVTLGTRKTTLGRYA